MANYLLIGVFVLAAFLLSTGQGMPNGAMWGGSPQQAAGFGGPSGGGGRFGRQAQGFGGGQGGFGGQGGYGIQNWYNTPEGWGYDSTYPGGETHFHSKRGGGQRGGFGGGNGFY